MRDRLADRFETALDAAIQRVVVAALIVRLMRLPGDPSRRGAKDPEPAAAIASTIGHVGVDPEITPTRGETLPIGKARLLQQSPHFWLAHEGKAVALHCPSERSERVRHWESLERVTRRPRRRPAALPASRRPAAMCRPRDPWRPPS